jgi:hypothetical protein
LADILRKNAPALRAIGIGVKFDKQRREDGYHVKVFFLRDDEVSKQSSGSTEIQAKPVQHELPEHENTYSAGHSEKNVPKTACPELHEHEKPTSVKAGNKKSKPVDLEPVIAGKLYETPDSELFNYGVEK